jgi:hypothetical protein
MADDLDDGGARGQLGLEHFPDDPGVVRELLLADRLELEQAEDIGDFPAGAGQLLADGGDEDLGAGLVHGVTLAGFRRDGKIECGWNADGVPRRGKTQAKSGPSHPVISGS